MLRIKKSVATTTSSTDNYSYLKNKISQINKKCK
uniref:Uncharacterized protein n=1 Tax=Myoviridae sp. ctULz28 TaxID=2823547 RepID=A0A8S5LCR9_9CAUD|nr:MAG TPA: hypothetical protein [Myoviridae sp. ctULz28]